MLLKDVALVEMAEDEDDADNDEVDDNEEDDMRTTDCACIRTLIVSRGWPTATCAMPAHVPAAVSMAASFFHFNMGPAALHDICRSLLVEDFDDDEIVCAYFRSWWLWRKVHEKSTRKEIVAITRCEIVLHVDNT